MKFFSRAKQVLREVRHKPASVLDALDRLLGFSVLEPLVCKTVDRRTLLQSVARELNLVEDGLLREVGSILQLPIFTHVLSVDGMKLPDHLPLTVFRRAGAIPQIRAGKLCGIVCVDPQLVLELLGDNARDVPYALATWRTVSTALDELEHTNNDFNRMSAASAVLDADSRAFAMRVLERVLCEANAHGANRVILDRHPEGARYSFISPSSGRRGSGEMLEVASRKLFPLLALAAKEGLHHRREFHSTDFDQVTVLERIFGEQYELFWTSAVRASATSVHVTSLDPIATLDVDKKQAGVLLIDDNETFLRVVKGFLLREGIAVEAVSTIKQALELLADPIFKPALIVCDVHMPQGGGSDLLQALRQQKHLQLIPLIVLTADVDIEMKVRFLRAGAAAFVNKNEDPRIFLAHVQRLLQEPGRQVEKPEAA